MTDVVNRGLLRTLRLTLYGLKRKFGGTLYVYSLVTAGTSYTTGTKSSTQIATKIDRAIILPIQIKREEVKTISVISANKAFVYGGSYDAGTRLFVIDGRDVSSDFQIDLEDWVVYNGERFSIKSIEMLELNAGWLIVGKTIDQTTGTLAHQEILSDISLTHTASGVIT